MKMNRLGRTDILVSEICLGTMTWGSQNTREEAYQQMDYALDHGVNFFDTAELYPTTPLSAETYADTERLMGDWFEKTGNRDKVVLATKVAGPGRPYIREGKPITGAVVRQALDASLTRLKTDYVDLFQIHWPNRGHFHFRGAWNYNPYKQDKTRASADIAEILDALGDCVKAGKLRAVGLSNETTWGTQKYLTLAEANGLPRVATIQNEYNLLYRHYDLDLAELSHHEDVGLLAYSPLAGGILSGKYLDGKKPAGSRGSINGDIGGRLVPHQEAATRAYVELAVKHEIDPSAMALAFCLTRPFMASVIIGATTMEQLKTNIDAAELTLSDEVMQEIAKIHRLYPMPI
ncbi:aldo/keto reductase [Agrobacterium sp. RAC06]|uniref:aldo/keto reductase n=1 Tax=Agrobacterium sp. RAC06 TaxID=1842536 RepID=UPI00083D433F|nr:aldo/keto reductase [Agrobacterium sp. RAC06]AOG11812.1 aldo/keto reductase family protein [Agrobacterium sp. RAC06]